MPIVYQNHRFAWAGDNVSRFWDHAADTKHMYSLSFANLVGAEVVEFLAAVRPLTGLAVLDYACGRGFLIPHLLRRGMLVSAAEYSDVSVRIVNDSFRGQANWNGAKLARETLLPWPAESFDVICALEVIEHVLSDQLDPMFQELHRLLKPEGVLLFTTPNEENLDELLACCPNCGSEFHRWQHMRAWSQETLRVKLQKHDYEVVFCRGMDMWSFQHPPKPSWKDVSLGYLNYSRKQLIRRLLDWLKPRPFPHSRAFNGFINRHGSSNLVAVATKPSGKS